MCAFRSFPDATDTAGVICGTLVRQSVLIRLYGDNTEAFIDRTVENSTCMLPLSW